MVLELILGIIAILIFLTIGVVLAVHLVQEVTGKAPFIPISEEVLPDIVSALKLKDQSVFYDLGCGEGRVVFAVAGAGSSIRAYGVERSFVPYILALWNKKEGKSLNAFFIQKNFFKVSVHDATHIFLYLFPGLMDALLPKLEKELKPGTRVVSCDFKFTHKQPVEIIDLHRKRFDLGRKIYVYEF